MLRKKTERVCFVQNQSKEQQIAQKDRQNTQKQRDLMGVWNIDGKKIYFVYLGCSEKLLRKCATY